MPVNTQRFEIQYGVAVTLLGVALPSVGTAERIFTGALTAGDVKLSKDGAALANPGTLPSESPAGSGLYAITLTAVEAQASQLRVIFKDQDGPAFSDTVVQIDTFGNAASLKKINFADAVRAGLTALPNANAGTNLGLPLGDATGKVTEVNSAAIKLVTDQFAFPVAGQVKAYVQQTDAAERTALANAVDGVLVTQHGAGSWQQSATVIGTASANGVPINSDLTLGAAEDWLLTMTATGLISTGWTSMVLVIKANAGDVDGDELLLVRVTNPASAGTDGVLRVNRAAATAGQRTQGSLSVGTITPDTAVSINVASAITALLPPGEDYAWELRRYTSGVAKRIGTGALTIERTLRRTATAP